MAITVNGAPAAVLQVSADLAATISDESGTGAVVFNTSPTLVTPTLGTASATAIELGHATDTTLARSSAGVITVEGVVVDTISAANTLTNKTLTSPVLGGTTTTASGNLAILPASYIVEVQGGGSTEGQIQLNCAANTHGQKLRAQTHAQAASNTLLLPGGTTIGNSDAVLVSDTGTQTITNKTLTSPTINTATNNGLNASNVATGTIKDNIVKGLNEDVNVVAAAATGTINFEVGTASIWYYTTNATANHTLNFRYSSSVSLNTFMNTGDSLTVVWLNTNGATAYYPSAFQIDTVSVTPKVPAAITAGNASSIDAYSFTIIKTASATFTVLETQTKFA